MGESPAHGSTAVEHRRSHRRRDRVHMGGHHHDDHAPGVSSKAEIDQKRMLDMELWQREVTSGGPSRLNSRRRRPQSLKIAPPGPGSSRMPNDTTLERNNNVDKE